MQDIISSDINTTPHLFPVAVSPQPSNATDFEPEQRLSADITELWAVHVQGQTAVKRTRDELRAIRQRLSERLYALKQILARPGRAGQWSSFLATHGIPRSNAELVTLSARSVRGI